MGAGIRFGGPLLFSLTLPLSRRERERSPAASGKAAGEAARSERTGVRENGGRLTAGAPRSSTSTSTKETLEAFPQSGAILVWGLREGRWRREALPG